MTTGGEGGMVTTNDPTLARRMWSYKDHGTDWDAVHRDDHPPGYRWLHHGFGTNWRMTEMQAALGLHQLGQLPDWHKKHADNAARIAQAIENMPVFRMPMPPADMGHAWYKAHFFVQPDNLKQGWDRDRIMAEINDRGVPCQTGICPEVYLESAFDGHVARPASRLPVAQQLGEASLMLPVHPTLSAGNMDKMCEALILVGEMASQ